MRAIDLDWKAVTAPWDRGELLYVRGIIDEQLAKLDRPSMKRKTIIRGEG